MKQIEGAAAVAVVLVLSCASGANADRVASGERRSFDGSLNNPLNPDRGRAGTALLRMADADYEDGVSTPCGPARVSARAVSNIVCAQERSQPNRAGLSDLMWQWGQFLDHDIDLTPGAVPAEPMPIAVPTGDPYFDPLSTGTETIGFARSTHDPASGSDPSNPRQQLNQVSAFIDGSNVYGSDATRAWALRTLDGTGRLRTSRQGRYLPFNTDGLPNAGGPSPSLYLAGDVRANEQLGLLAMHTLFVREHNRLADQIRAVEPGLDGDAVYERARRVVGAQLQVITVQEFLPLLLGPGALAPYADYDDSIDPGIGNAFSTVAYRFGHSMLSEQLLRLRKPLPSREPGWAKNHEIPPSAIVVPLREAFFNPSLLRRDGGLESILIGLASQRAQEVDPRLVDSVRNFLFGPPGAGGFDLAALNVQRGRDHGISDYNALRIAFGLTVMASPFEITPDPDLQDALALAYPDMNDIDPWAAGMAEEHLPDAIIGETFHAVLVDQFSRLRDGDRFWYLNDDFFTGDALVELEGTRLADIIRRNTNIRKLGDDLFHAP